MLRLPLPGSRRRLPDGFPLRRVKEVDRIGRKVLQVEGAEQRLEPVELFPAAVAFVQTFNPPIRMAQKEVAVELHAPVRAMHGPVARRSKSPPREA